MQIADVERIKEYLRTHASDLKLMYTYTEAQVDDLYFNQVQHILLNTEESLTRVSEAFERRISNTEESKVNSKTVK